MKNLFKKRNLIFQIAVVSLLTLTITSCEKEALAPGSDNADFKKGRAKAAPAPSEQSIAEIAINAGFSELVNALSFVDAKLETGLVDLFLNGTDQYTVFAPTNDAFEALYDALGVTGIGDEAGQLNDAGLVLNVLLYHVTEGRRAANSVVPPRGVRVIETLLEGATFNVDTDAKITAIGNTANILVAQELFNISASNGIIHVIDAVILPIVP